MWQHIKASDTNRTRAFPSGNYVRMKIVSKKDSIKLKTKDDELILCSNQRTEVREINPNFDKTG